MNESFRDGSFRFAAGGTWGNSQSISPIKGGMTKEEIAKRREKNEANMRLTNYKKSFTRPSGTNNVPTLQEKI